MRCRAKCCFFGGPSMTKKEKDAVLRAGFKDYFIPCHEYFDIKVKKGKCPYLKNCLCSIHKVRPVSCKIWPVFGKLVNGKKKYVVYNCPLTPYLSKKELMKLKKMASKLPNRFYKLSWEGHMPKYILKKIERFRPVSFEKFIKKK